MRLETIVVYSLFLSVTVLFAGAALVFQEYWTRSVVYCGYTLTSDWISNLLNTGVCNLRNTGFKVIISGIASVFIAANVVNFFMAFTGNALGIAFGLSGGGSFTRGGDAGAWVIGQGEKGMAAKKIRGSSGGGTFGGSSQLQSIGIVAIISLLLGMMIFYPIVSTMDFVFTYFPIVLFASIYSCLIIVPTIFVTIRTVMKMAVGI